MKICLAPLRGLTGAVFRNSFSLHFSGVDWAVTPFLTTIGGTRIKPSQLKEVLPENNQCMPIVPQILSKTADRFIILARALFDLGYDTVNWNLGCPFPRVAKKMRGSGLLPHADLIEAFLSQVMPAIPSRLSIKTRLGRHDSEEIFGLIHVLNNYPIKELTIHPRTGVQMYKGAVDFDTFEKCLPLCRFPVTYNGDIKTKHDFKQLQARFPSVSVWMIGRGLISNPFLAASIKGETTVDTDWVGSFRLFHQTLLEGYAQVRQGPAHLVDAMKGYWNYFADSFENGADVLKLVKKARSLERYNEVVEHFFDSGALQHRFNQ